uniref:Uncharacterized protein n=1 Tax=Sphaerodactylus townsendi TaxID=933632 RepID=A0ACB8FC39_9SAUR
MFLREQVVTVYIRWYLLIIRTHSQSFLGLHLSPEPQKPQSAPLFPYILLSSFNLSLFFALLPSHFTLPLFSTANFTEMSQVGFTLPDLGVCTAFPSLVIIL